MKYGLFFLTYNGCVQAAKKCIKGLNIAVQSNKSLNMRKSLVIISKIQKGTKSYYDFIYSCPYYFCFIFFFDTVIYSLYMYINFV